MQLKKHRFFYFLLITLLFSNLFLSCELLLLQQMLKTSNVSYESDSNIMDGWKYFFNYNDFDMAILCFQKAVKKDTLNFYAYNCLGLAYQRKGEWEKSIDAYKKSIKINPKNAIIHKNLGIVYFLKGDYNRAIDAFQNSISIEPLFNTYFSMGITYNLMGKYDMAIESQLKAIEFNENNSKSYYEIGLIYLSNKEYDKSIESFQKSLQLDSSHAALSYKEIGEVYCKIKDYDKAISAYQKAIKLVEGSPYFFYDQGIIFNSPSKEIEVQVIRVLPDNKTLFKLYFKIGNFYYYQKNYDKAIEAHEKALKILPPDAEEKKFVYYNIGFIYNKKGDFYKQNKDEAFNKAVLHGLKLEFIESQLQKDLISDFFWEEHYYSI